MNSDDRPFDQLARDSVPASEPDPGFVRRLRSRLIAELAPPVTLPNRKAAAMPEKTATATPLTDVPLQVITPYITVHDGAAALDWYVAAFGAGETVRYVGDDGRVGHAEFVLHGATIMLSDAYPEMGVVAANSYEGSSCTLHVTVPNCDAAHALAVERGATSLSDPGDQPHGARSSTIMDPFGHRWMLSHQIATLTHAEINEKYDEFTVISNDGDTTD